MNQKVAVIGASGVVGRALLEHLDALGIEAIGYSRRPPADLPGAAFSPLDLTDASACQSLVTSSAFNDVTHIVYAALYEKPGLIQGWREQDQMQTNLSMLRNLLSAVPPSAKVRHITLLQGTKAYGAHVEPMRIPGREREPRHNHENFYWLQEDYLKEIAAQADWQWTIWRPQIIFGHALHAPMNMLAALGVYAALQKHKGLPLTYPGGPSAVTEAIDADLLAEAIAFSFDNDVCAGETFNITNGDVFRWQDLWGDLANIFGMDTGTPDRRQLSASLYEQEQTWLAVTNQHGLKNYSIRELVGDSFFYADALLNTYSDQAPPPALLSTIKLREAGFSRCIDTVDMFAAWYEKLAQLKVLPRFR